MPVQIEESWRVALADEFEKEYFKNIVQFLKAEKAANKIIYPKGADIFNAFSKTPFDKVKAVLLGQDPYHGAGQAHGLCFSVLEPTPPPPSLVNIYKELHADIGFTIPTHGNLEKWAIQGLLMLNASLTVRANEPMSHSKIGWETFTNAIIKKISDEKEHIIFILWGKFAQNKKTLIDLNKHFVLEAAHPSPLSAHNGFWGCKHFSKANDYLIQQKKTSFNWQL
jgi:uracil-DNA glycosylase